MIIMFPIGPSVPKSGSPPEEKAVAAPAIPTTKLIRNMATMQNSPLLVTKTSPVNSVNSSINQEQSKQPKDSFESVLSKHVKHNETQASATKNDHANKERVNATGDDNVSKADVALGKPVDASEELLQTLADSAMVKGNVSEAEVE